MKMNLQPGGWFDRLASKEAARDRMRPSDRTGQMIGAVFSLLFAVYFFALYNSHSGFFLSTFSSPDGILFFGIAIFGAAPSLMRAITGRKNSSRPMDIIVSISILVAAVWFSLSFPFDFSHLPNSLPESIRFLMSWISDGLARLFLLLAVVVSVFIIPYTTILYIIIRQKLSQSPQISERET